jgi:hypothetical protein
LVGVSVPFLAACHGDVTFRFDVHGDGTALATARGIMDDQLYELALSQNANGDLFGTERLQREGWTVSQAFDENGNHVITISKLLSRNDLTISGTTSALRGASLPFSSIELSRSPGLFVERDSLSATIPALLPWAQSALNRPYLGLAAAVFGSTVAVHLELRTPGKVLATNGERTPNGFVRWDLGLQAPTTVLYTVRVIHFGRILAIILIALAALLLMVPTLNPFRRLRSESRAGSYRRRHRSG